MPRHGGGRMSGGTASTLNDSLLSDDGLRREAGEPEPEPEPVDKAGLGVSDFDTPSFGEPRSLGGMDNFLTGAAAAAPRDAQDEAAGRQLGGSYRPAPSIADTMTTDNLLDRVDRAAAGQLCSCVPEKHWSRGWAMFTLALVDLLHVLLTIFNMHEIWQSDGVKGDKTGAKDRAKACLALYVVKAVTHTLLVVIKMVRNGRGTKMMDKYGKNDALTRWRHSQQWFVAMTFNSFLMLPVFLFIATTTGRRSRNDDPFDLVRWQKKPKQKLIDELMQKATASERDGLRGELHTLTRGPRRELRDRAREKGLDDGKWIPLMTGPERGTRQQGVGGTDRGRAMRGTATTAASRVRAARNAEVRVGVLAVFADTGAGGLGFAPTYVMITNIACTVMAMLINAEALANFSGGTVAWASLITVFVHFLLASWLYLYAKLASSQEGVLRSAVALAIGMLDAVNVVLWLLLVFALMDVGCDTISQNSGHCHPPTCPESQPPATCDHRDADIRWWRAFCWVWLGCITTGMSAQAIIAILQARLVTKKSLSEERIAEALEPVDGGVAPTAADKIDIMKSIIKEVHLPNLFVPCCCRRTTVIEEIERAQEELDRELENLVQQERVSGGRAAHKMLKDKARVDAAKQLENESNGFAAVTFNTWLSLPSLLALKRPYDSNLLDTDGETSPFCRPYSFNSSWLANFLITITTLSRAICVVMCVYMVVSHQASTPGWGEMRRLDTLTHLFSFTVAFGTYIAWASWLFVLQSIVAFTAAFLWTNPLEIMRVERSKTAAATVAMLVMCLLDLAVLCSTGYYAGCIISPDSPLFECQEDFGPWMIETGPNSIRSNLFFRRLAIGALTIYCLRIVVQSLTFWSRRTATAEPVESSDTVPLHTIVFNGIFHGAFLLFAQYPVDLPVLLNGRWSLLQPRPHWTNGLLQILVLIEKTVMGYLVLELVSSQPCPDGSSMWQCGEAQSSLDDRFNHAKSVRSCIIFLFTLQAAIQFFAITYAQVWRPGRLANEVKVGDHIKYTRLRRSDTLRTLHNNGGVTFEVLEKRMEQVADDDDDASRLDDARPREYEYRIEVATDDHTTEERWVGQADCVRFESWGWQLLVVGLAFLDWFHIAFNLTNLIHMLSNNQWDKYSELKSDLLTGLCYTCISIYSVRVIVQPVLLVWRGAPVTFSRWVFRVLTAVDVVLGIAIFLIATIALPGRLEPVFWVPLMLIGIFSVVTVALSTASMYKTELGCLFKLSNGVHVVVGLVEFGCGFAIAIAQEDMVKRARVNLGSCQLLEDEGSYDCGTTNNIMGCNNDSRCQWREEELLWDLETWGLLAQWVLMAMALGNMLRAASSVILAKLRRPDITSGRDNVVRIFQLDDEESKSDATAQWSQDPRWYSALTFNTFLMLPSMMLVESPYRDSSKTVTESFVRLGSKGWIDYFAGLVLLLMVIKKSINGYLIVEWIGDHGVDDSAALGNIVSMTLLVLHFIATLYVMMVPKLAHSQRPNHMTIDSSCCCLCGISKATLIGMFLLTIALVDWLSLLVNLMSAVNLYQIYHNLDKEHTQCNTAYTIWIAAMLALAFGAARIVGQIVVYVCLRASRGQLRRPQTLSPQEPNYDPDFRHTSVNMEQDAANQQVRHSVDVDSVSGYAYFMFFCL